MSFTFNGKAYTVERRRQAMDAPITLPMIMIYFFDTIPRQQFVGGNIGYNEDGKMLHGWLEEDVIIFEVNTREKPMSVAMGSPLADIVCARALDHILCNWDRDILMKHGMCIVEPVDPPRYIPSFIGPEYAHVKRFTVNILNHYYYPRFEENEIEVPETALEFELILTEVGMTSEPEELLIQ
jgi:hypothetical protein